MDQCCWNCNSPSHHRVDCPLPPLCSARDNKKEQMELHRLVKPNHQANKRQLEKMMDRRNKLSEPIKVTEAFLEMMINRRLDWLWMLEAKLDDIGAPNISLIKSQQQRAVYLKDEFKSVHEDMRELYTEGKKIKSQQHNTSFNNTLDWFNSVRNSLWYKFCDVTSTLQRTEKLYMEITDLFAIFTSLTEDIPRGMNTDVIELTRKLDEIKPRLKYLRQLAQDESLLNDKMTHCENIIEEAKEELQNQIICKICTIDRVNCTMGCGHTICSSCFRKVSRCPICRYQHRGRAYQIYFQ